MLSMEGAEFVLARQRSPPVYCGELITSKGSLRAALATGLHTSVDGAGLAQSNLVPQQHQWLADASSLLSGANYIGAVKVCGNLLPTAARGARGRPLASNNCDAHGRPETLGHILQVCPRTHASRIARHDRVATVLQTTACKRGWSCIREPAIPTRAGLRKPDLIFHHRDRETFVLDVTIVADHAALNDSHQRKVQYYDVPDIRCWIERNVGNKRVHFSSVTLSWRGLMAPASAETLSVSMALGRPILSLLSVVTCERGLWIYEHFHKSTFRVL